MAFRVTDADVATIIDVQSGKDLTEFIRAANILTTDVCGPSGYPDDKMRAIELWLSAHFYTIFDNQLTMARAGTVAVGYAQKIDYGLRNSMYGQQAIMLDTDGNLAALENTAEIKRKINIDIIYLGNPCRRRRNWWADAVE